MLVIIRKEKGEVICTTTSEQFARVPLQDEIIRVFGYDGEFVVVAVIHTVNHGIELVTRRL